MVPAVRLTVVVSERRLDSIVFPLIVQSRSYTPVLIGIIILYRPSSRFDAAPCNRAVLEHEIERQLIRQLACNSSTVFLSFPDPPVNTGSTGKIIGTCIVVRIFLRQAHQQTVACISYTEILIIISHGSFERNSLFCLPRLFRNDIHHAAHRFAAVQSSCRPLDDFYLFNHFHRNPVKRIVILQIHRDAVHHDKSAPVITTDNRTSRTETEILPTIAITCTGKAHLAFNDIKSIFITCLLNLLSGDHRLRRRCFYFCRFHPLRRNDDRIQRVNLICCRSSTPARQ